jgi:hypothetical protein
MDGEDQDDGPVVFAQVAVDMVTVPLVIDLVRLSTSVIDELELDPDDLVVSRGDDRDWEVAVPDYLVPLTRDLIALATDPGPRPLEPSEVSSELLDTAGLIASLMGSTDGSFPMLEAFFAILGLPIDAPFAL